jgi:hypothetical protein
MSASVQRAALQPAGGICAPTATPMTAKMGRTSGEYQVFLRAEEWRESDSDAVSLAVAAAVVHGRLPAAGRAPGQRPPLRSDRTATTHWRSEKPLCMYTVCLCAASRLFLPPRLRWNGSPAKLAAAGLISLGPRCHPTHPATAQPGAGPKTWIRHTAWTCHHQPLHAMPCRTCILGLSSLAHLH